VALLQKLAAKTLADRELAVDLPDPALRNGSLGGPGATAEQLLAAEARLGVRLPPSYLAFLETSNGWGATSFFLERLLRVDEIVRFADSDPTWVEAWKDNEEAPALRAAIQVSTITDNGVCLLIPSAAEEWEAWWFANWIPGAHRHESFLTFMRSELDR
jgi:cell wall assembly regulator SMI1